MRFLFLFLKSFHFRKFSILLSSFVIALGVTLILGIHRVEKATEAGFQSTISKTDLIVAARGGSLQTLLYTVFHIGNPSNSISWNSFKNWSAHPEVDWSVPIALGDSHRGFRVIGTQHNFFDHMKYGNGQGIEFEKGVPFDEIFDVVIGSDVAQKLNYSIGDKIHLSHGLGADDFQKHDDVNFVIKGILKATFTPLDRALFTSLEAIEAIHVNWQDGYPTGEALDQSTLDTIDLSPKTITAFFLGTKSKFGIFQLQREIQSDQREALSAIMPGVAFLEMWQMVSVVERAFWIISALVLLSSLVSLILVLLQNLHQKERELAIIRSLGAGPFFVFLLQLWESIVLVILGLLGGFALLTAGIYFVGPFIESKIGFQIELNKIYEIELWIFLAYIVAGAIASLVPAVILYRKSLSSGLVVKQ